MHRTRTALAALTASAALVITGCGNDSPAAEEEPGTSTSASTPTDEPTESPDGSEHSDKPRPMGPFADITIQGDRVTPNGERVDLEVGQTLTLRIDADQPGELHVHSTPEQEISFPAGQSERKLTIDQPGVVDVEDHETGTVLLQLEVR